MAITKLVADSLGAGATPNQSAFKNIIINGDMSIAQRGTSISGITGGNYYTVDRFRINILSMGTWTMSQETDVPSGQGFANSLKMDCTTADASPSASDLLLLQTRFEGQNLQYLKKGTANAESLTLSLWVKSNKTGTYIAELYDEDNSRNISKSYTINVADTWEKKTITYAGDTTGTLDNDNNRSLYLNLWLCAGTDYTSGTLQTTWGTQTTANKVVGQVNLADSTSNYINITGVQLEAGTTASDFEFLPYDVNLARCQRYFYKTSAVANMPYASGVANGTTNARGLITYPQIMRTSPSMSKSGSTNFNVYCGSTNVACTNVAFYYGNTQQILVYADVSSGLTNGQGALLIDNSGSSYITGDSEL
jgi:hypothetical protein